MLRLGIILTVTGVIALLHRAFATTTRLSPQLELGLGVGLVVVGVALLVVAVRR